MTAPQSVDKCVQRLLSSLRALPPQKRDGRTMAQNTRNKSTDSNGLNSFRIVFVALAAVAVWFRVWEPFPHISVVGIAATLIGGYPLSRKHSKTSSSER
jgi:hypothetical protein